tara:strand:- start:15 stop:143 length:129 start_codon:yes stop_codon:yes gene_type:complete
MDGDRKIGGMGIQSVLHYHHELGHAVAIETWAKDCFDELDMG